MTIEAKEGIAKRIGRAVLFTQVLVGTACGADPAPFSAQSPARGPSELLGDLQPVTNGAFAGGDDAAPTARVLADGEAVQEGCDDACHAYCDSLALQNPINKGACASLWGKGIPSTPVIPEEACRRLFADTLGRLPSLSELQQSCLGKPWSEVVHRLVNSDEFVRINRRQWADRLGYNTQSVSVERVYDMDRIVTALAEGRLAYDQFASVVSAHPVLMRSYETEGDRAEALFWLFLGRPPFGDEKSDVGRLYHLWDNNYYDHPELGARLPDAWIRYRCVDENGKPNPATVGECTSTTFGTEQVILSQDTRAVEIQGNMMMWSGFLSPKEWAKLQIPGKLISKEWLFWEHAVNVALNQYFGYELATAIPEVGEQLVRYLIDNEGDVRSLHYAILTSTLYLQSATGSGDPTLRYTYGPFKQTDAETWVDSLDRMTGRAASKCDIRLNRPRDFLDNASPYGIALVADSDWQLNPELTDVKRGYADLVRTLGGCPDNSQGGRFKIVSVLTTANQLNYAGQLCDPGGERSERRAKISGLLPSGVGADAAITEDLAAQIIAHQTELFFGRTATETELTRAREHGTSCALGHCSAEEFARPVCFALLSSSEMIFY